MFCMLVTLDVSKVSGWLNAFVYCRVQRGAWEAGDMQSAGGRRPVDGSQGSMWGPSSWRIGQVRSRTANMYRMLVTLEVSKLSGWLNARAFCRVHRQGIDEGGHRRWGRFAG